LGRPGPLSPDAAKDRSILFGSPPNAFPDEFPLALAIAPGLVVVHDRSAAIIDNLNMMLDVLTDVLVHRRSRIAARLWTR
jgi:hypothetical protein